jgi:hypothetical protein
MRIFVRFSAKRSEEATFLEITDVNKSLNFANRFGDLELLPYLCSKVLRFI